MQKHTTVKDKNLIISEYLTTKATFVELEAKYGVNYRTIQSWVRAYRERSEEKVSDSSTNDVADLKEQLEQQKMNSELLEEMLRLSEQHTGIALRKKFGTKRS